MGLPRIEHLGIAVRFSATLMLVLALMGRDIVGDRIVNTLDYYHYMGLVNLAFIGVLWACRPNRVIAG